jgi:hypothetical protein
MCGTLVCVVDDSEDGRKAVETAIDLSERLGSRFYSLTPAAALHRSQPREIRSRAWR